MAGSAVLVNTVGASTKAMRLWMFNGPVDALALSGKTLYAGGHFTQISPRSGPIVADSASSGRPVAGFPSAADGAVKAVAADGKGGWFVGGTFHRLGGLACPYLVHVTAAMRVDPRFCPRPNDYVLALALDGQTLYVGGSFTRAGGARRANLAALSTTTGQAASWAPPAISDAVDGMAVRNGVLYLLGDFSVVGGKNRFSLAAVDVRTRRVTGWDPKAPEFGQHGDTSTHAVAAGPNAIYVGGIFDHIGGRKVAGLAALDPVTGRATGFVPAGKPWTVETLLVAGGRLYAGGLTHTGGYLAAYDAGSGKPAWVGVADPSGVDALAAGGTRLFAGGARLQAFNATTGHRAAWAPPGPNQTVRALDVSGDRVVVGGDFSGVGGVYRDGLATVDLGTGQPTAWHPRLTGLEGRSPAVTAIAVSGPNIYIGGDFSRVGGKARIQVAAVSATGGQVTSWAPKLTADNQVLAIAARGSSVYLGGFGVASSYDASGKLRWNSPPGGISSFVHAIAVVGNTVYLGGSFDVIGGATRHALVAVDAENGSTTAWEPRISESDGDEEVHALAVRGSTLYVGGSFDSAGGTKRHLLASFDTASGKVTTWAPKAGAIEDVYALTETPAAIYAGGDGGARAFDPKTGATLGWRPSLTVAGFYPTPYVHALAVAGSTVYVGDEAGLEAVSR
jgi:hypothetical protein